jgi:hypothetical protein
MMHRSKKPLRSGVREYFNRKRPVNMRVDGIDGTAHLAEAPGAARTATYPRRIRMCCGNTERDGGLGPKSSRLFSEVF